MYIQKSRLKRCSSKAVVEAIKRSQLTYFNLFDPYLFSQTSLKSNKSSSESIVVHIKMIRLIIIRLISLSIKCR